MFFSYLNLVLWSAYVLGKKQTKIKVLQMGLNAIGYNEKSPFYESSSTKKYSHCILNSVGVLWFTN